MGIYSVLIYGGQQSLPARRVVTASDTRAATAIADDLLAESPSGVGVELVCDGERLYTRGVVPVGAPRRMAELVGASAHGSAQAALPHLGARGGCQTAIASRSRANFRT